MRKIRPIGNESRSGAVTLDKEILERAGLVDDDGEVVPTPVTVSQTGPATVEVTLLDSDTLEPIGNPASRASD